MGLGLSFDSPEGDASEFSSSGVGVVEERSEPEPHNCTHDLQALSKPLESKV